MRQVRRAIVCSFAAAIAGLTVAASNAAVWDGGATGNWTTATDWDNDDVPNTSGETADTNTTSNNVIAFPQTVNLAVDYSIDGLFVRSGDTLTYDPDLSAVSLTVATSLSNDGTITLNNNSNTNLRAKTLTYEGTAFSNTGTINLTVTASAGSNRNSILAFTQGNTNAGIINITGLAASDARVTVGGSGVFINTGTITLAGAAAGSKFINTGGEYRQTAGSTVVGTSVDISAASLTAANVNIFGGTLSGTGVVNGAVMADTTGTIAAGTSSTVGTLATNSLSFGATGVLDMEIDSAAATADKVNVTGDLSITSGATLTLSDLASTVLADNTKLVLVDYSGTWDGGTFSGYADDFQFMLGVNSFIIDYNDSEFSGSAVTVTAVPEPASMSLLAFAAVSILRRRRRGR